MTRCPDCPLRFARSKKQHGRLFAVIEEAFKHWPETADFQPSDKEHLRYWLEKEAGLFDVALTYKPDKMKANEIASLLRLMLRAVASANPKIDAGHKVFIEPTIGLKGRTQVVVKVTRSIAWLSLAQDDFNKLSGDVYDVLAANGFDHDRLLAGRGQAA